MTDKQIIDYLFYNLIEEPCFHFPRDYETEIWISELNDLNLYLWSVAGEDFLEGIDQEKSKWAMKARSFFQEKSTDNIIKKLQNLNIFFDRLMWYFKHIGNAKSALEQLKKKAISVQDSFIESQMVEGVSPSLMQGDMFQPEYLFKGDSYSKQLCDYLVSVRASGKNQKVLVPIFKDGRKYNFSTPPPEFHLFYNHEKLKHYPATSVILTDSIELAKANQNILDDNRVTEVIWLSWYDACLIPQNYWKMLGKRSVYYLLKEHSQNGNPKTYNDVLNVYRKILQPLILKSLKFISYLPEVFEKLSCSKNTPSLLSVEEFLNLQEKPFQPVSLFDSSPAVTINHEKLFSPLIYSGTVSVFYGQPHSSKTFFALSLAIAASQNGKLFEQWQATGHFNVYYFTSKAVNSEHSDFLCKNNKPFSIQNCNLPLDIRVPFLPNLSPQSLVFLDSTLLSVDKHPSYAATRDLLRQFKEQNCAVVWILNDRDVPKLKVIKNELPIDSLVKFTKLTPNKPNQIALQLDIEKGFKMKDKDTYTSKVQFNPNEDKPSWRLIQLKRSKEEEIKLMAKYLLQKKTGPEIARLMNISESKVKRMRPKIVNILKLTGNYPD